MKPKSKLYVWPSAALLATTCLVVVVGAPAELTGEPMRRVLLVRDSAQVDEIEQAAALSLDLPRASYLPAPATSQDQDQTQAAANVGSNTTDYRSVSLAALTLGQRAPRATDSSTTTNRSSATNQQQPQQQEFQWPDTLRLARLKPSWLNVPSRFKITGASIEELAYMMPAEYMLRQAFDAPVLLKTRLGLIEGVRSIRFNKHLYAFLSVPYARPPVDELRFRAPQPIEAWGDSVLQATKWPPFCVQPSMTLASKSSPVHPLSQLMTEDCLYLNIWTPSLKLTRSRRRPVMVWIHGGAFQYGGISVDENDASALALAGDLVVVTLNYRISAFGFLNANNREQAPNNVGLLDQRMALEWVQQNIKQFGGDPQQVTLFGESAGGHSVGLHLISPGSQALFKRAIMQSGVPISFLRSYDVNIDNKGSTTAEAVSSIMMARRLKCLAPANEQYNLTDLVSSTVTTTTTAASTTLNSSSLSLNETTNSTDQSGDELVLDELPLLSDETIECMRNKSSLDILKAMGAPGNAGFFPTGNDPHGFFSNGPIQESFDAENLKVGPQKDFLIGTNTDEGTFMLHYGMPSLFPARAPPKVNNVEALKEALQKEIERMASEAAAISYKSVNGSTVTEIQSASGTQTGGAQAHLYRPLLKTSTSVLEGFMPKSRVQVDPQGNPVNGSMTREAEFGKNVASLISDIIFLCPARTLARTLSEAGRNVYFYLYSHKSSQSQYHDWIGVTHHDEVEFVFGRPLRLADVYSGKDIEMSQRLIKTWAHFAYTGQGLDQLGVKWPKYGEEDNYYVILNPDKAEVGERYHDRVCNVYDNIISVHLQDR